jgi:antitoxin component YwqK of YwqJK toxin-antitoxin module
VIWYHANGTKKMETFQKQGLDHGPYRAWHENGQLKVEGHYSEGKETGTWREWDAMGKLISVLTR